MASDELVTLHLNSERQSAETTVRLLIPATSARQVMFVLPVEPIGGQAWGDPFAAIVEHGLHDKYGLVCVFPTFSAIPWYANHPTDRRLQQEAYFIEEVLPLVADEHPESARLDRVLIGFSKSGLGAVNLLLRHRSLFAKAAVWDAPLGMASFRRYGAAEIFGTQENFESYSVWTALERDAQSLQDRERIGLFGYDVFRGHMQAAHYKMLQWGIPHHYADGPRRAHRWDSGWLPEAVAFLAENASQPL